MSRLTKLQINISKLLINIFALSLLNPGTGESSSTLFCLESYGSNSKYSAQVIEKKIQAALRNNSYGTPMFQLYNIMEEEFASLVTDYNKKVGELHKQGIENKAESAVKLSVKLLSTLTVKMKEIDGYIKSSSLHSEKAKGVVEVLKKCSLQIDVCKTRLQQALAEVRKNLKEVELLKQNLIFISHELNQLNILIQPLSIEFKISQFSTMISILERLKSLLENQEIIGVNELISYPDMIQRMQELEVQGVDIGILQRQSNEKLKDQTQSNSPRVFKDRSYSEFPKLKEFDHLLETYPESDHFKSVIIRLKYFNPEKLAGNFENILLEFASVVVAESSNYNGFSYENYKELKIYSNRSLPSTKELQGYSLSEVKQIIDLLSTILPYQEVCWECSRRFAYINSTLAKNTLVSNKNYTTTTFLKKELIMTSDAFDKSLLSLTWSLLARLRHSLSYKELDLFVEYIKFKFSPIVENIESIPDGSEQNLLAIKDKAINEAEIEYQAKIANYHFYTFKGKKEADKSTYETRVSEIKNRYEDELRALPSYKLRLQLAHLKESLDQIENTKKAFFQLLIEGTMVNKPYSTDGTVSFALTPPKLEN